MIYLVETPRYYDFLSSPIPERLGNRPEFIRHFNLPTDYDFD